YFLRINTLIIAYSRNNSKEKYSLLRIIKSLAVSTTSKVAISPTQLQLSSLSGAAVEKSSTPLTCQLECISTIGCISNPLPRLSNNVPVNNEVDSSSPETVAPATSSSSSDLASSSNLLMNNSSIEADPNATTIVQSKSGSRSDPHLTTQQSVIFHRPKIMDHRHFERHVRNIMSRRTSRGQFNHKELEKMHQLASYFLDFRLRQAIRDAQDDFNIKFGF
ncbi:unnamed protein product, partial [Rotaria sordida]